MSINQNKKNNKGSIALTLVLVITSLLITGSIMLVLSSIDVSYSTKNFEMATYLEIESRSCLEEALREVSFNPSYTGIINDTFGEISCSAVVANDGGDPSIKVVDIQGNYEDVNIEYQKRVDVSTQPFQILD